MAGIHVAEALGIPYFRAFTMPWTCVAHELSLNRSDSG